MELTGLPLVSWAFAAGLPADPAESDDADDTILKDLRCLDYFARADPAGAGAFGAAPEGGAAAGADPVGAAAFAAAPVGGAAIGAAPAANPPGTGGMRFCSRSGHWADSFTFTYPTPRTPVLMRSM